MINEHQQWLSNFYKSRGWLQLSSSRRLNFLTEEVGELSQAIRKYEFGRDHPGEGPVSKQDERDNLVEELADVLDEVLIFCEKYDITVEELVNYSENKIKNRFDL
ncbi:NTP pyrophosphatase (non-canonical NTP hydrolase) [Weissella uvarum]|uniref:MazG-like family protein n=1 Tax=Weissella uvarum TaxID=1479233 RepID=UPI001EF7947C|nr:MazG-like family protein [Weissella uvarum]MBM7616853.1 NTP pyrophosphatase (non-canonical NTP hydrolase) [Weissella uvarum]